MHNTDKFAALRSGGEAKAKDRRPSQANRAYLAPCIVLEITF